MHGINKMYISNQATVQNLILKIFIVHLHGITVKLSMLKDTKMVLKNIQSLLLYIDTIDKN